MYQSRFDDHIETIFFGLSENGVCPKFDLLSEFCHKDCVICARVHYFPTHKYCNIDQVLLFISRDDIPVYIPIMDGHVPLQSL